jgi:hypothetical protein
MLTCWILGHRYYFTNEIGEFCLRCGKRFPYVPGKFPVDTGSERLDRLISGAILVVALWAALHLVA